MKTDIEELEKNTVLLKVEVPIVEVTGSIKKAYKEVSEKVRIPGFRKGKAPKGIIDQMVGKEVVLNEALQELIPFYYPKAVESSGVEPVSMPEIDIVQIEEDKPLIFTAKIQVKPKVVLGDYHKIEIEEFSVVPTKEEVEREINNIREKFSHLKVLKRRNLKKGDFALIDFQGFIEGKPFEGGSASDYMLEIGSGTFIPGFEEQLVGAKRGEERDVKVTFPHDYSNQHLADKEAVFRVAVKEIKEKELPALNDEFAKNVSEFDTLREFKKSVKEKVRQRKEAQAEAQKRSAVVDFVINQAEMEIPPVMIENQINAMVRNFEETLKNQGLRLEDYLRSTSTEFKLFKENYRAEAIKRIKTDLVLEAVQKAENIEISDEDVDNEIKRLAKGAKRDFKELKKEVKEREGYDYLRLSLQRLKTVDFLVSKAKTRKKKKDDEKDGSSADSN